MHRGDHRLAVAAQVEHRELEAARRFGDAGEIALEGQHADPHQVGADAEVGAVVADHQAMPAVVVELDQRGFHHLDHAVVDRVHLGVELEQQHAVVGVEQAGALLPTHHLAGGP